MESSQSKDGRSNYRHSRRKDSGKLLNDVNAVLTELTELVQEYLQVGQTVRINGLGRFSLAIESNVVEHPADFSIERDVRAVKCNFVPEGRRDSTKGRNYLNRPWIEDTKVQWAPFCKPEK